MYEGFARPLLYGIRPATLALVLQAAQTGGTYEPLFAGIERNVPKVLHILAPALQLERHRRSSEPLRDELHCIHV